MGWKLIAVAFITLLTSGCVSSTPTAAETSVDSELANAKAQWSAAAMTDYQLKVYEIGNFFTSGCIWTSTISDGEVADAALDPKTTSNYCGVVRWNVEMLHSAIATFATQVDSRADSELGKEDKLSARYDQNGVPIVISFDLVNSADEESTLVVAFEN